MRKVNIFWFRRDLREKDNRGFYEALTSGQPVLPLFIFDPLILEKLKNKSDARVQFLFDQLSDLNEKFKKYGSAIQIFHGPPKKIFQQILKDHEVESIFTNEDYEPQARERDEEIKKLAQKAGVEFKSFKDQVIMGPLECLKSDGTPYLVYTPYSKQWKKIFRNEMLIPCRSEDHLEHLMKLSSTSIKSLKDIGFKKSSIQIPGKSIYKSVLKSYREQRDFPWIENGTTHLGVHLRFGTVSVRHAVKIAKEFSETWLNELIWREFFMMILFHFPHTVNQPFSSKYSKIPWREDEDDFQRWKEGQTGYPLVDAGVRELVETGYMHNRVRMVVASFLCKHLLLPWTWGERFFAEHLLDFELSSNVGNWQWTAGCGVDAAPYFRVFNPHSQQQKFDKDHKYIGQWVPEWNQESYPEPMVDHEFARRRALKTFKENME